MSSRLNYRPFFTPTQISGCALWLDAGDSSTIRRSGNSVIQWNDKSGSGFIATQNNSLGFPTLSGNSVLFSPNQALRIANFGYNPSWTLIIAMNSVTLGARWFISHYSSLNIVLMGMNQGVHKIWNALLPSGGADLTGNHIEITTAQNTAASAFLGWYRDGILQTSNITNAGLSASPSIPLGIGANASGDFDIGGTYAIYELVLYKSFLNDTQRQQVEGYLAWKWNLVGNLPANHPFKTAQLYRNPAASVNRSMIPYWRLFQPTQIQGCQLWLDGADSSVFSFSGSSVTQWNDKSGFGRNAVGTVGAYGTYSNSALYLTNSLYTTTLSADPVNETCFLVFTNPSGSGNGCIIGAYNGGRQIANYDTNTTIGVLKSQIQWGPFTTFPSFNTRYIATAIISPASTIILANGGSTSNSAAAMTYTSGGNTLIGREVGLNFGVTGFLHEFVVFNRVLSTTERQQLESYLVQKWGLRTSLPAGHRDTTQPAGIPQGVPTKKTQMSYTSPFNTTVAFTYTGGNQTFTVPANITRIQVIMWGAGGSGGSSAGSFGGAGAFLQGTLVVTPGQALTIMVGQAGTPVTANFAGTPATYGGGGGTKAGDGYTLQTGSGGGMSAIRNGATYLAIAGGGGGSGIFGAGGAGSSRGNGANGTSPVSLATFGTGGTAAGAGGIAQNGDGGSGGLYQGTNGAAYQGGTGSAYGGGGGGGYGGGGGGSANGASAGGGGGGSSFSSNLTNVTAIDSTNGILAPNSTSPFYDVGVAVGGTAQGGSAAAQRGGNGRVVIRY